MRRICLLLLLAALPAWGEGESAGEFDYYVMALSWSPTFCATEAGPDHSQCARPRGWVLHGLWPQYERGWPSFCPSVRRNPSRAETAAMADIMGSAGSAWHQWKKHGRCTGLEAADYYALARRAYGTVTRPEVLRDLDRAVTLPASVIEDAFLAENPTLEPDMITITCKAGRIQEARVCLTRALELRNCGADVSRDCNLQDALLAPIGGGESK